MRMPAPTLMVLHALTDDRESIDTMRDCGEMAPHGLALIGEDELAEAVATLLVDGLIEAFEETPPPPGGGLVRVDSPRTDTDSISTYWFGLTNEGERVWSDSADLVYAYYNAHPPHRPS